MSESYKVAIEQPRRVEPHVQHETPPIVETFSVEGVEQKSSELWKPYEDSKYESPVLNVRATNVLLHSLENTQHFPHSPSF